MRTKLLIFLFFVGFAALSYGAIKPGKSVKQGAYYTFPELIVEGTTINGLKIGLSDCTVELPASLPAGWTKDVNFHGDEISLEHPELHTSML